MLAPRTRLGRYEIVAELGRGGMAVVYEAVHVELGKPVALKELQFGPADAHLAERFLREARTSGALGHPNLVAVFDYFEHDGLPYIAMELVPGGSLRPLVGTLTLAQIAGVMEGVLVGLAHAERRRVVHRDLKPENLLITDEGLVKIADFGIAKAVDRTASGHSLTGSGATIGTPTYMAPEQARAERITPAADLYSLGVIAYELLTRSVPFGDGDTPAAAILMQHIGQPVPDPLARNPDLDPELAAWTLRMLAKQPSERPAGAVQAWDELEPAILRLLGPRWRREAPLPVSAPRSSLPPAPFETPSADDTATEPARPASPPAPPEPPPAPRRWLPALLVAAAVAVLAGAAALGLSDPGSRGTGAAASTPRAAATAVALTEAQVVRRIRDILAFSAQGRGLRVAGRFDAALVNRRQTLERVRALRRQTNLLGNDLRLLETAALQTVNAVRAYQACGGSDCAPAATHASGQAKLRFTKAFNPLAQRYLHRTYGAADF